MKRLWSIFGITLGVILGLAQAPVALALPPSSPVLLADFSLKNDDCSNGQKGIQIALPWLSGGSKCISNTESKDGSGSAIIVYLKAVITALSAVVVAVIMFVITYGGFEYISSIGDPKRVASGKNKVTNALIALVLFMMMFAILNFLVPGGLL